MDSEKSPLVQWLHSVGHASDEALDLLKNKLRNRFEPNAPLQIVAYRGFGNKHTSSISGRVLAYRKQKAHSVESRWTNLQQSYRRFETDEIPNVLVEAKIAGKSYTTSSDAEGYFAIEFPTPMAKGVSSFNVELDLPEKTSGYSASKGTVHIPRSEANFGVISDIDDTVLQTNATSVLQMMRLTLLESSRTRLAFSGVGAFYQALHNNINPFFYVSSSPWNLYDFLIDFMQLNNLVDGPLMLRDFGVDTTKFIAGPHLDHKLSQIRKVLLTYPNLQFILVGDSGQDDPEIYQAIIKEFPNRILACYIRDVSHDNRDADVHRIIAALAKLDVDMLLVPDTLAAAVHASSKSWIAEDTVSSVRSAVAAEHLNEP